MHALPRSSLLLAPIVAGLVLLLLPVTATAGGRTIAVGARTRNFTPAMVAELWLGRFGLSAEAGIGLAKEEDTPFSTSPDAVTQTSNRSAIRAAAAVYYTLARGKQTQLSAGLRYGYGRGHTTWDDGRDKSVISYNELSVPLRVEVWPLKRLSIYIEFGVGARKWKTVRTVDAASQQSIDRTEELFMFGDPLGNAGVSFHF